MREWFLEERDQWGEEVASRAGEGGKWAGRGAEHVDRDHGFAREVGDTLVFMDDGVVVESGDPREVIAHPRHERTQAFLSKVL